jgi:DNA-binding beta-propeller fold protein YncE
MHARYLAILSSLALLAAAAATTATAATSDEPLVLLGRTNLNAHYDGDVDHLFADIAANKLFMAAEDHGTVEVFNLATGQHLRTIGGFSTPHAFFLVPGTHRLIVTQDGKEGSVVMDDRDYRVLGYIRLEPGADTEYYDPSSRHLFIVTGGGDVHLQHCWLNEIDPWTGKLLRRHEFDSDHVEALAVEQQGQRIFINIANEDTVDVLDKRTLAVSARWKIEGAALNLNLVLDEPDHRLFVVTRKPTEMFVLNTDNGRTVASLDVPAVVDGLSFDAARKRVYVPGAVGEVGVYQELDPDHYRELARVPSALGGKSELFVPRLGELFVGISPQYNSKHVPGLLRYRVEPQLQRVAATE